MEYDDRKHVLLELVRHKYRLDQEEYENLVERAPGVVHVEIPEWPPVEYPPLQIGGGNPFDGMYLTGTTLAVEIVHDNYVHDLARGMVHDYLEQKRVAYQWQVTEFDEKKHVVIRSWLAENEISIVDFYRQYLPQAEEKLGRDPIIEVTNPKVMEERERGGGYSPTTRAVHLEDLDLLAGFAGVADRFTYDVNQAVSWIRSLDGTRWEARKQYAPQNSRWDHRSFIQRAIGDGAWSEADRDIEGNAHAPWMELWDDGTFHVWVLKRAIDRGISFLRVNGVDIPLRADGGVHVWRMTGQVPLAELPTVLGEKSVVGVSRLIVVNVETWDKRGVFLSTKNVPEELYREKERPPLVIRRFEDAAEVRVWGDMSLSHGITLNEVILDKMVAWNGGWKCRISNDDLNVILTGTKRAMEDNSQSRVVEDAKAYSSSAVIAELQKVLGTKIRLFGQTFSDSAMVALTEQGMRLYLKENDTDRDKYIADQGNRNYDCENFSEQLRCGLQRKYGVNGIGIIWGDGHAWNFFVINDGEKPEIIMIEPQTDKVVTSLSGMYSIQRRCEILL